MNFPPETQLGRYKIISLISAGGMGEVYLAQDTALQRKVALKVLSPDVAVNQDRMRRFKQEATSAASLNHPNIAHIYEIGEAEGFHFIAMEYVQGQTLEHQDKTTTRSVATGAGADTLSTNASDAFSVNGVITRKPDCSRLRRCSS